MYADNLYSLPALSPLVSLKSVTLNNGTVLTNFKDLDFSSFVYMLAKCLQEVDTNEQNVENGVTTLASVTTTGAVTANTMYVSTSNGMAPMLVNFNSPNAAIGIPSLGTAPLQLNGSLFLIDGETGPIPQGMLRFSPGIRQNYIESSITNTSGSAAPLVFTDWNWVHEWARFNPTIQGPAWFGIGTSTPGAMLHVNGNATIQTSLLMGGPINLGTGAKFDGFGNFVAAPTDTGNYVIQDKNGANVIAADKGGTKAVTVGGALSAASVTASTLSINGKATFTAQSGLAAPQHSFTGTVNHDDGASGYYGAVIGYTVSSSTSSVDLNNVLFSPTFLVPNSVAITKAVNVQLQSGSPSLGTGSSLGVGTNLYVGCPNWGQGIAHAAEFGCDVQVYGTMGVSNALSVGSLSSGGAVTATSVAATGTVSGGTVSSSGDLYCGPGGGNGILRLTPQAGNVYMEVGQSATAGSAGTLVIQSWVGTGATTYATLSSTTFGANGGSISATGSSITPSAGTSKAFQITGTIDTSVGAEQYGILLSPSYTVGTSGNIYNQYTGAAVATTVTVNNFYNVLASGCSKSGAGSITNAYQFYAGALATGVGSGTSTQWSFYGGNKIETTATVIAGGTTLTSDARLKRDIREIPREEARRVGRCLRGVSFEWTPEHANRTGIAPGRHSGTVAQHVRECLPEAVQMHPDEHLPDRLTVDYTPVLAHLLVYAQDLDARLEQQVSDFKLQQRVNELEARVNELVTRFKTHLDHVDSRLAALERTAAAPPPSPSVSAVVHGGGDSSVVQWLITLTLCVGFVYLLCNNVGKDKRG